MAETALRSLRRQSTSCPSGYANGNHRAGQDP